MWTNLLNAPAEDSTFLRNVGYNLPNGTAQHPTKFELFKMYPRFRCENIAVRDVSGRTLNV
jgi:hypothetical protein